MESSSIFKPYESYDCWHGEKQTILKNSIGRQLPYIVNFKSNVCQLFDVNWEKITHCYTFPEGCNLIDVDYFPSKEGQLGILVGVEDPNQSWGAENYVVALAATPDEPTMRVTYSSAISSKITVVKTLFSNLDMVEGLKQKSLGLFRRLLEWPHIVAIGCKETKCFLAHLTAVDASAPEQSLIRYSKRNLINVMDPFISGGSLQYSQDDGCFREYPVSAVYISALALMPRSRTLLVGLSMGGILAAALNPSNHMMLLELRHERLIRKLAPLEPEDDPDKFEFFIAAVDRSSKHPVMIQLWRGSFKTSEEVEDCEKYDRPMFNVCLDHKIPFGERWLAVNPIVTERGLEGGFAKRRDESFMDSMLNVSQSYGSTVNRSHVLLAYERRKLSVTGLNEECVFVVEAAVFDIDAWYYKRVPGRVQSDGTSLRQCAFLSQIQSDVLTENVSDIGILTLLPTDVSRFTSMVSDADQLYYPSALSYERVFVAEKDQISWMKIQNIQQTILDKCASRLPLVFPYPRPMAGDILAAGLVRKNILSGSPNSSAAEINDCGLSTDQKVVLNAMVYYGKIVEFCNLATCRELDDHDKMKIAEWAVHEAVDYKRIVSDRTVSMFQGSSTSLSPLAEDTILQGIKLFRIVHEYLRTCAKNVKDVKDGARLTRLAHSVKCMRNHTKLASRFIIFHIVPVDHRVQQIMREMHEKRKNIALKYKTALPIQVITRNMHRLAPDTHFWNDLPHDEWYPPTPLDLLESVLTVNIPERVKRALIVQYIIDWLRANPTSLEFEEQKLLEGDSGKVLTEADKNTILAVETIKVMTNQMLDVDLEKIYVLLDQEKASLTKKTDLTENGTNVKQVFSLGSDGLSYEQLWSGNLPMMMTIGSQDIERFEQRMKMQTEEGGKKKMQVFDPETEMLYQAFLFENQKYELMSPEAVESNEFLCTFLPGMICKGSRNRRQKSEKELEIEGSVRAMMERNQKNKEQEVPEVFAALGEGYGRKRKSESGEEQNTSPVHFVPPTAKRIQWRKSVAVETTGRVDTTASSVSSPQDADMIAEMNRMIATPARYYKRPATALSVNQDMTSPVLHRKLPPVPAQNSILKTAKLVQSPSRGRIRFHESVRKGANESINSTMEEQMEEDEVAPRPKVLDFAVLEDEEENETAVTRQSILSNKPVQNHAEEGCIEMEKSFETQEEFQVLEDTPETAAPKSNEETFETRTDDVIPGTDETFELTEREEMPEKMQNGDEDVQVDEIEEEEIVETKESEKEGLQESVETEEDKERWDGIHRSFELQKDEDCEPLHNEGTSAELVEEVFEEADIPLDRTFEVQDDDPQPCADVPYTVNKEQGVVQQVETVVKEAIIENSCGPEDDRPPSANTRSKKAADSRAVTPVEPVVTEPTKPIRKARAASVQKHTEVSDNDNEDRRRSLRTRTTSVTKEALPPQEEKPKTPRKARASSVKKDALPARVDVGDGEVNETITKKTRASSVKRTADPTPVRTTRARSVSRSRAEVSPVDDQPSARASRSTANSRSVTPSRISEEVKKPRKSPARGKKTIEEELPVTPEEEVRDFPDVSKSTLAKRVNSKKTIRASSVVIDSNVSVASSAKRAPKSQNSAPSTPKRGRSKSETEDSQKLKRRSSESDDQQPDEPPKKARGRPRVTPLKVIPETTDEAAPSAAKTGETPKRGGSRSRNNSTSSTAAGTTTPKRGRKAILDEVAEESEDAEPAVFESVTPKPTFSFPDTTPSVRSPSTESVSLGTRTVTARATNFSIM